MKENQFADHVLSANVIEWDLECSSVIPEENNRVNGTMVTDAPTKYNCPKNVLTSCKDLPSSQPILYDSDNKESNCCPFSAFRGSVASEVEVHLIPSNYKNHPLMEEGVGFRVQYMSEVKGTTATAGDFMAPFTENALKFTVILSTGIVQLELDISTKNSMFAAFAEAGGLFGALSGLIIVLMNAIEFVINSWTKITAKAKEFSSSSEEVSSEDDNDSPSSSSEEEGAGRKASVTVIDGRRDSRMIDAGVEKKMLDNARQRAAARREARQTRGQPSNGAVKANPTTLAFKPGAGRPLGGSVPRKRGQKIAETSTATASAGARREARTAASVPKSRAVSSNQQYSL